MVLENAPQIKGKFFMVPSAWISILVGLPIRELF